MIDMSKVKTPSKILSVLLNRAGTIAAIATLLIHYCQGVAYSEIQATSIGQWSLRIGIFNSQSGAGSDLVGSYESALGRHYLSVQGALDNSDNWRIDVSRSDANWPSAVDLFVRRIDSTGTGTGVVENGGTTYQEVETIPTSFCYGRGNIFDVELQYKISGISLQVPPGVYTTSVIFTVVDTL